METGGVVMSEGGSLDEEGIDRPTAFDTSDAALLGCGSGSRTVPGKSCHPGGIFGAYAWFEETSSYSNVSSLPFLALCIAGMVLVGWVATSGAAASPSSKRRHQKVASRKVSTSQQPEVSTKMAMEDGDAGDKGDAGGTNIGSRLVGDGNIGRSIGEDGTELLASGTLETPRVAKAANKPLADLPGGNLCSIANASEVPGPIVSERRRRFPAIVNGEGVTRSSCDPAGVTVDDVDGTSVMAGAKAATGTIVPETVSPRALSRVSENDIFSSQGRGDPPVAAPRGDRDGGEEEPLLGSVKVLLREVERNLDAARVLLPECHRFRKVVECVSEAVGPGMRVRPRQSLDLTEALKEATEFSRTLSTPEAFLVVIAELLADGVQDPSAMLGQCTRRLSRAVSALPEPTPSGRASDVAVATAVAARAKLRSIAKACASGSSGNMRYHPVTASGVPGVSGNSGGGSNNSGAVSSGGGALSAASHSLSSSSSLATVNVTPPGSSTVATAGVSLSEVFDSGDGKGRSASVNGYNGNDRINRNRGGNDGHGESVTIIAGINLTEPVAAPPTAAAAAEEIRGLPTLDSGWGGGREEVKDDDNLEGETACGSAGPPDGPDVRRTIGPALTSEAAGLSDLIRRRGGLGALSDGRTVAAVLRAAAPRRQSALHGQQHQHRARGFFEVTEGVRDGVGGGTVPLLSTPPRRRGIRDTDNAQSGDGGENGRGDVSSGVDGGAAAGAGAQYVSTTCSGIFFSTKSPLFERNSPQEELPWPSPQDTGEVCQKLARRVESRVEAMAPFTCPNPVPASERRRLRNANIFFFSILASDLNVTADLFRVESPEVVVGESGNSHPKCNDNGGGDQSAPSSSSSVRGAAWSRHRGRRVSGGRARREDSGPDFEEQLYTALGALLEAAKELLPGAREGGVAVNAVGKSAVLTLKGTCALNRAPSPRDTSLTIIPRKTSMCQHTVCTPRFGRKTLEGGVRHEDGVLLVPDCRKLRQEMLRNTCMDPVGAIRPDYVAYAGAPVFIEGAPLGSVCVFSRRTLKDLGWSAHHTAVLRGLADAASTEIMRLCRLAELDEQQHQRKKRVASESPKLIPRSPPRVQRFVTTRVDETTIRRPLLASCGSSSRSASPPVREPSSLAEGTSSQAEATMPEEKEASAEGPGLEAATATLAIGDTAAKDDVITVARGRTGGSGGLGTDAGSVSASPTFLTRLDGDSAPASSSSPSFFSRRRFLMRDREQSGGFRLPLLTRRVSVDSGADAAAIVASTATDAGTVRRRTPGSQRSSSKKRWRGALSKLGLRPRRSSQGEEKEWDEGDEGRSSSAEVSHSRFGDLNASQVFVERSSKAW